MQIQETVFGSTDIRQKSKPSSANGVKVKLPKLNMGGKAKVAFLYGIKDLMLSPFH